MLNKAYFTYLLKSKKYFLIIVCILQAIMAFAVTGRSAIGETINYAYVGNYLFGLIMAFILPLIVFSYIHNKKAIDTYFSLNMSRNTLLFTGLIYCFVVAYGSYFVSSLVTIVGLLVKGQGLYVPSILVANLIAIVSYALIIEFNTFIYSLANTITDGIVILLAYCFLPLGLYIFAVDFQDGFTIGVNFVGKTISNILVYISPLAMSVTSFILNNFSIYAWSNFISNISYFIVSVIYLLLFGLLLFKTFKIRKAERAGNYSDEFFAYPFIIGIYTILCLFIISVTITTLNETIVLYVLLFAAYFIGNFVYKRKFMLSKKQVILFVLGIALSACFNQLCIKTNGFNLSYTYDFDYDKMSYSYNSGPISKDTDSEFYDFFKTVEGLDESNLFEETDYVYFSIYAKTTNKEVIDIFEKYREQSIESFYSGDYYSANYNSLSITYDEDKKDATNANYASPNISIEDFIKIMELDNTVEVTIYDFATSAYHIIYEDGKFMLIGDEYYSIYSNFGLDATRSVEDSYTNGSD